MQRIFAVALLVALTCLLTGRLLGQEGIKTLSGAAKQFAEAEREIDAKKNFWAARELLEEQAMLLAEQDLDSKDSEKLLQWILGSPRSSPTAMRAAKYLATHHGTSGSTVRWLLNLSPREWTPDLFATVGRGDLPPNEREIFEVCRARHDMSLLELSDEIKLATGDLSAFELRLGKGLTKTLLALDADKFESHLIDRFTQLSDRYADREVGGMTIPELAEGAIFSIGHLRLGKTVAELAGTSVDGDPISLAQCQGKVVFVDFWATWCAPCVSAMPQLKELKKHHGDEVVILGVNVDQEAEAVRKLIDEQSVDWLTIWDADAKLQKQWLALSLPTYYVLDQDRVVRYRGSSLNLAANAVEAIVASGPVAAMVRATFDALDKNGDRCIGRDELPPDKQHVMDTADLNKDGFLSVDELTVFTKASMTTTSVEPNARDKR